MVVIHLYGVLEKAAQRTLSVRVESFEEAMRALLANFPKLRAVLCSMNVSVMVNGDIVSFDDCVRPMNSDRIDIMPAIGGNGPAVMILAGAALTAGATTIASMFAGTFLASVITSGMIAQFGIAMIIGGISQLLFKPPKPKMGSGPAESTASYNFNGAVNTSTQGNVVPVGFGRMRVGSQVISANIQTWDIPATTAAAAPLPPPPSGSISDAINYVYDAQFP